MPALDDIVVMDHLAYRGIPAVRGSLGDRGSYRLIFRPNGDPDLIKQILAKRLCRLRKARRRCRNTYF